MSSPWKTPSCPSPNLHSGKQWTLTLWPPSTHPLSLTTCSTSQGNQNCLGLVTRKAPPKCLLHFQVTTRYTAAHRWPTCFSQWSCSHLLRTCATQTVCS